MAGEDVARPVRGPSANRSKSGYAPVPRPACRQCGAARVHFSIVPLRSQTIRMSDIEASTLSMNCATLPAAFSLQGNLYRRRSPGTLVHLLDDFDPRRFAARRQGRLGNGQRAGRWWTWAAPCSSGVMVLGFQRDEVELAVTHAAFGHQRIGELADPRRSPLRMTLSRQLSIEMAVQGRHGQVVMIVLQAGQALGQFAFVMVIDIGTGWRRSDRPAFLSALAIARWRRESGRARPPNGCCSRAQRSIDRTGWPGLHQAK